MCVHVNGLDSLAVDHHRQALAAAALLSPRRIPQPTTAENDAGRGAGTLEKIPTRVHVRLPVDHFDRTSRTAGTSSVVSQFHSSAPTNSRPCPQRCRTFPRWKGLCGAARLAPEMSLTGEATPGEVADEEVLLPRCRHRDGDGNRRGMRGPASRQACHQEGSSTGRARVLRCQTRRDQYWLWIHRGTGVGRERKERISAAERYARQRDLQTVDRWQGEVALPGS